MSVYKNGIKKQGDGMVLNLVCEKKIYPLQNLTFVNSVNQLSCRNAGLLYITSQKPFFYHARQWGYMYFFNYVYMYRASRAKTINNMKYMVGRIKQCLVKNDKS